MENYILSEDRRVGPSDLESSMVFEDVETIARKMPFFEGLPDYQKQGFIEGIWQGLYILATPHQIQRMDVPLGQQSKAMIEYKTIDDKIEEVEAELKAKKRSLVAWILASAILTFSAGFQVARLLLK